MSQNTPKTIDIKNLSFARGSRKIISDLSLKINLSGIISILGPNGSGKTTLLKLILGLLSPSAGSITICEKDLRSLTIKQRARLMAYVPQNHRAIFGYKAIDIAAMGRVPYSSVFCTLSANDYEIAKECMSQLEIENLAQREYNAISTGEQQLVLLARALAQKAKILILDEPVNSLDYGNQIKFLKKLKELAETGICCIQTTHFPQHALWVSNSSILLKSGQVAAEGPTKKVINTAALKDLYNIELKVEGNQIIPEFQA